MNTLGQNLLCTITRRHFFHDCKVGLGSLALASLFAKPPLTVATFVTLGTAAAVTSTSSVIAGAEAPISGIESVEVGGQWCDKSL